MDLLRSFFGSVDMEAFHADTVNTRASGIRGIEAARAIGDSRSLGIQLDEGLSWTFIATEGRIRIEEGIKNTSLVVKAREKAWSDLITEAWSIMGLIFQGRVIVEKGEFNHVAKWEAPLQALYNDRPIWFPSEPEKVGKYDFQIDDDLEEMKSSLNKIGFLLIRDVFSEKEIQEMDSEVEQRRSAATVEDKRSWWATDTDGVEHCCRVTYLNQGSDLFSKLPYDDRLLKLSKLASEKVLPTPDHGDGVSVVIKVPEIVEGLADLPWHRDCGMGGHPLLCPGLNVGIQLDQANSESGQLCFLAGSNSYGGGADHADFSQLMVPIKAEPGDVTIHYGHTLHVAPAPKGKDKFRKTIYVSFHIPAYQEVLPEGQGYNDVLFTQGDGRVRNPGER